MIKKHFSLLVFSLVTLSLFARTEHYGNLQNDPFKKSYKELPNPVSTDMSNWRKVSSTNVSWGSTDIRYRKEVPPLIKKNSLNTKLTAWRGEKVSSQFIVWSNCDINNLSISIGDLKHKNNRGIIESNNIESGFVRYVMTDQLNIDGKGGCGQRPDASIFDSTLVADPIDHITKSLSLPAYNTQGVWIKVQIPKDVSPGIYKGVITVMNDKDIIDELHITIEVIDRLLPKPENWSFFLDLWQNPFSIARIHNTELWSDDHFEAMKPYMEMYKNAGGKSITASIMHKPWNAQTYDYFETMVTWIKKADGTWMFDYTIFDKWVEFMIGIGINQSITCYSMIPWKLSFQYFDQATNKLKFIDMKPGDNLFQEVWGEMLSSFSKHLRKKNWFDITYISMDERPMEAMKETIKVIKSSDSEFKISLAGALHEELSDDIDYFCVPLRMKYPEEMRENRKKQNKITTYYTSCEEAFPNTFTFSSPADCEWFGWYAAKEDLDGYLRWAYNSWVADPITDSRFYTWAAGDTYFIYPGAITSIRYERLIAGIQAYEKVRILKKEFTLSKNKKGLRRLEEALSLFDESKLDASTSSDFTNQACKIVNSL